MLPGTRYLASRAAATAVAGLVLFAGDRLLVAGRQLGVVDHLALWGAHTTVAAAWMLLGGAWVLLGRASPWLRGPRWTAGLPLALAGAWPMFLLAEALVSGDWVAKQRFALVLKLGVLNAGLLALAVLGWLYARTAASAPGPGRKRFILPAALLVAAVGAAVADALVLPGLYPAIHFSLYVASSFFAVLATSRAADLGVAPEAARAVVRRVGAAVLAAALLATALLVPGRVRTLSGGSRVAALILPHLAGPTRVISEELAVMNTRAEAPADARDTRAAVDALLGGRRDYNVLLVVVDALRADTLPPARRPGQPFAADGDTPFLDAWLAGSFRFRRAYSQASRTRRSMPPTFRSTEANEDTERIGLPLGAEASELGFLPVAVVPQYFLLPESEQAQHLLLGFDRVSFYEKNRQERIVDRVHDAFEGVRGRRFFAWVHFYNMHEPYFADRPLSGADGSVAQRYRTALRWLDAQMAKLWKDLEAAGLAQNTVVFFTADHGEHVGLDGRVGHGGSVVEAEVRAPLAVRIPGRAGGEIDVPAGNIDIVPTVLDLAGAPPRAWHKGRSLLPILAGADHRIVPLYMENSTGGMHAVTLGAQKLVHVGTRGVFHRYDLANDPAEADDLYNPEGETEYALRRAMLRKNPSLFADELRDRSVRRRLVKRLSEVGADARVTPALRLLLQLAALSKDGEALSQGARIFREAREVAVQVLVARHLSGTDPARWTALVSRRLADLAGKPDERAFVEGLAADGQRELALDQVAKRLAEVAREPAEAWAPWLALVRGWNKPPALFAAPLGAMLSAFPPGPRSSELTHTLVLLLECAGSLAPEPVTAPLRRAVLPALGDPDPRVAVVAARALGSLRATDAAAPLHDKLSEKGVDARIRQAILYALADLEGEEAVPTLIREGEDPLLTVDVVQLLGRLGSAKALPFLRTVARTHYNFYTRQEAAKAIKRIEH